MLHLCKYVFINYNGYKANHLEISTVQMIKPEFALYLLYQFIHLERHFIQ